MKVLLLNGSTRKNGCTYLALSEVAKVLEPILRVPPPLFAEIPLDLHALFLGVVVHVAPAHITGRPLRPAVRLYGVCVPGF